MTCSVKLPIDKGSAPAIFYIIIIIVCWYYSAAECYYNQALEIYEHIYGECSDEAIHASVLNNYQLL